MARKSSSAGSRKVRYAVVGLGHIAQTVVLPAFRNARRNSELVALISGSDEKRRVLGKRNGVEHVADYADFEACLERARVDAVFIALPNHLHREFTERAARVGVHVLCEKPLAVTARDCAAMIKACTAAEVKLMTAYRLHFERVNLEAIEAVRRGRIGEPQVFQSSFSFQVRAGDTRVRRKTGGGTLYDIGVYCINAARYLFQAEPIEVLARSIHGVDRRSGEVDAITSAVLTFPKHRVATFTTSFCSAPTARFAVLGSKGELRLDSAYEYEGDKSLTVRAGGREQTRTFPQKDQFGAEIVYFSDCVLKNRTPEPSGEEGMADVAIVEALYRSAATGRAVALKPFVKRVRPNLGQAISLPAVPHGKLVAVEPPSMD